MSPLQNYQIFSCLLIILFAWASSPQVLSRPVSEDYDMVRKYEDWIALHGRVYQEAAEKESRYNIFKENVKRIETFNANPRNTDSGYKLAVNQFADLTNEEFRAKYTGYKSKPWSQLSDKNVGGSSKTLFRYTNFTVAPGSMDWRLKKAVTPVKDQGNCGK